MIKFWFSKRFSVGPRRSLCLGGESVVRGNSTQRLKEHRAGTKVLILGLAACFFVAICSSALASGELSAKQIRKLIARLGGIALPSSDVRIKSTTPVDSSTVEATATIETAFRFEQNDKGQWRVAEVRTGPGQWEEIELLARALKTEINVGPCDDPDLRAKQNESDPSVKRARCLIANLLGIQLPSDAVRIREVSPPLVPFGSHPSALVVATVEADFRLLKTTNAAWRVAGIRTGNRAWADPDAILAGINADKAAKARADLELIAQALEAFRRERGFYVESKSEAALIDHLSPRYLTRVIRIDPWLRPYLYEGTRDRFTLRSTGLDNKENTGDDIIVNGPVSRTARQSSPN